MHLDHTLISIAPMMRYTDRHFLRLMRYLSQSVELYTEMVTTDTFLYCEQDDRLRRNPDIGGSIILQLGGSDPGLLASCVLKAHEYGYNGVNLNVGCPSSRVVAGKMGAVLMYEPELVAECISAMQNVGLLPISIKTRIGVDRHDDFKFLENFIKINHQAGCKKFIIHARKAWLNGLNPKQNRTVPPVQYQPVLDIKALYPDCRIELNGAIRSWDVINKYAREIDGFMIGRMAYQDPYWVAGIDQKLCKGHNKVVSRREAASQYITYARQQHAKGIPYRRTLRHLTHLFRGCSGAARWRQCVHDMMLANQIINWQVHLPELANCTENAA